MSGKKCVTIIGPYGEIGGVSIHIRRLTELLENQFTFTIVNESRIPRFEPSIVNLRKFEIAKYLLSIIRSDVVHIHSGKNLLIVFHMMMALVFLSKAVVTLHSYKNPSQLFNFILKLMPSKVMVVSAEIMDSLNLKKAVVLNAFIPPISERKEVLNESIRELIRDSQKQEKFVIAGNAFRLVEFNKKDLYGVDQLIELAIKFKSDNINAVIIFFVGSLIKCTEKYQEYQTLIKKYGIEHHIILINERVPFIKVIELIDLVVRPTLTDGDALTIRESLYFNKPVIASDVVKRPKDTVLYKSADVEDLFSKVKMVMTNAVKPDANSIGIEEYEKIYQNIYETSNSKL